MWEIFVIDNKHISRRFHRNRSGLYLNYYGTKRLQENVLNELAKLDWDFEMIGMNTISKESIRVRNKNKGKRKKNKNVDLRNSIKESSYEHISLSSEKFNESFLLEPSDTLNDDLIELSKQRVTYPKNLIIGHINRNSERNKFWSLQQTVLSKTDIIILSETKIDDLFPGSQFFAESFKMYRKDRTKIGGGVLLYVYENLLSKMISSYKLKESSKIVLLEFSVSNKKRLLLGNYRPLSKNYLSFFNELNLAMNSFNPI